MHNVELSNHIRLEYKVSGRSLKLRKPVCGVGINDADYCVSPRMNGKQVRCPAYASWVSMFFRCLGESALAKRPNYSDVSICDEWRSFMAFRSWWIENQVDGWQLDKDLLIPGSKTYSPATCIFIPLWLNALMCDQGARRGGYSIGVNYIKDRGCFAAYCRDPITKKGEMVGRFKTEKEANMAYVNRKIDHINSMKSEIIDIDKRLYESLISIMKSRISV